MSSKLLLRSACALVLIGGGLLGFSSPPPAMAAERGAACISCHDKDAAAFNSSFHARAWRGANDCQSCHGSTDQHIKTPGKNNVLAFSKGSSRNAEELNKQCLACHDASTPHLSLWEMGQHSRNGVACVSCHTIHTARPTVNQPDACFSCHRDIRMAVNKQSHHPIIEGKVKCSDCHNPHGTLSHGMIKEDNVNQLCYKCHAEKRGPFIWEHPPVEENCAICHDPHGSRHSKLMKEKIPNLCQDCHDWSRHPGTPYDNNNGFTGSAPSNRFLARSCLNCHNQIHGSTSPANPSNGYNPGNAFVR